MSDLTNKEKKLWLEFQERCRRIRKATVAPQVESEKDKQKRIASLMEKTPEGFERFCRYYFPDYMDADFGWFHKKGIRNIQRKKSFNVWEWPREHAKSVLADVFMPIRLLAEGWLTGMILASETEPKAKVLIRDIEAQLRSNQRLIADFGEQPIMGSWKDGHFSIANKGIGFWAFGLGQNPAGSREGEKRPNYGVVDDASSKKKAKNQERVKEDVDWVLGEFMGCLSIKDHIFVYANNRVAKGDLTSHIVGDIEEGDPKREGIAHIKVFATEDEKHRMKLPSEGGKPAWKERYTQKHIFKRILEMGYRNAMRQFYHLHIEDGNVFKPEHIVWVNPKPLDQYDALVSYCDPSFSGSKTSDFKGIVLLGLTGKYIDILWAWVRQTVPAAMINAHFDLKEHIDSLSPTFYDPESKAIFREVICRHYIEGSFAQKLVFVPMYDMEADARGKFWRPVFDDRQKPDKRGRIENMEPAFEAGIYRWNAKLKKNRDMQTLKDQFLAFPNGKDDGPDAVEGGSYYLHKKARAKKSRIRTGRYNKNDKRNA